VYGTSHRTAVTQNTWPLNGGVMSWAARLLHASITVRVPWPYQWKKIVRGVTQQCRRATNIILTLSHFNSANTASYFLQASNGYGVALSTARSLTVISVPSGGEQLYYRFASQTGTVAILSRDLDDGDQQQLDRREVADANDRQFSL